MRVYNVIRGYVATASIDVEADNPIEAARKFWEWERKQSNEELRMALNLEADNLAVYEHDSDVCALFIVAGEQENI